MGIFKVIICDDERTVLKELKGILKEEYGNKLDVTMVLDLEDYIRQLERQEAEEPDVAIMDIQWNKASSTGIDGGATLQQMFPKLKIIFLTGYLEYAVDIFKARPSNFLIKPINREKLTQALDQVFSEILRERSKQIILHTKGEVMLLDAENILYVECNKHELIVHCLTEDKHIWMKLNDFLKTAGDEFIRIHQSYAVNALYVQKISADGVEMINDLYLPVSRRRYTKMKNAFLDYLEAEQEIAQ